MMNTKNLIGLLVVVQFFIGITSCNTTAQDTAGAIQNQSVEAFKQSINLDNATLIDIRTPKEYAAGHIEGAIMVDWNNRTFKNYILNVPQDKPILVYCRSGNRTGKAVYALKSLGFSQIYNLDKGIKQWEKEGQAIVTTDSDANIAFQKKASSTTNDIAKATNKMKKSGLGKIQNLSALDFQKAINMKDAVLIDVRTLKEYDSGHIAGAKMIDWNKRSFKDLISKEDKNKPMLIYCRSGNRTGKAAAAMQAMGFKKIFNLAKGVNGWTKNNLPLVTQ